MAAQGKNKKKLKQRGIVYDPKEVVIPSVKVASCCHLLKAKYRPQRADMGRLVFPKPLPAVTGSPDHNPLLHPKEAGTGQNPHQEEIIRKLATQLRHIGDGIHRRTTQLSEYSGLPPYLKRRARRRAKRNKHFRCRLRLPGSGPHMTSGSLPPPSQSQLPSQPCV
ncbi:hypothetical protein H920_15504 [Fukomys damarensis]|uniref:Uncharacterized protein n=1 Tax=Fukomys damarensis TaxID=885580 RepID=A0A091DK64_FUKDA|nr:hypothetical protein H920_15504 [Fukomys damarensis]